MAFDQPLIATAGDVRRSEVPKEIMRLAEKLSQIHGTVIVSRESSGCHLYMASPIGLEQDGARELEKRHLAVNADKHFGFGVWKSSWGTYDPDLCAMCMKTEKPYRVSDLKNMAPIGQRGHNSVSEVQVRVKEKYLVSDGKGNMVPEAPGTVVPITSLPANHPAVEYLTNRPGGPFNLKRLEEQFNCGYCTAELPERHEELDGIPKKFYPPMPCGWKDTPQGRIVFYCMINGAAVAWQARILEKIVGNLKMFWHPYAQTWDVVEMKIAGKWQKMPNFDNQPPFTWKNPEWNPSKYKTAKDAARNQMVGGLDAALAWNVTNRPRGQYIAVVCEGPLDAGRAGSPALFLAGKFISEPQVKLITANFQEVVWVGDDDEVGKKASIRVRAELGPKLKLHEAFLPEGAKDLGELSDNQAQELLGPYLK